MDKHKAAKKLALTRETLRSLAEERLRKAAGGSWFCSRTCPSGCEFCTL